MCPQVHERHRAGRAPCPDLGDEPVRGIGREARERRRRGLVGEIHAVGQIADVPRWQAARREVVDHTGQDGDHGLGLADEECLDRSEQPGARRAGAHRAEVDERLRPQVADLEDEPGPVETGDEPPRQGRERMNGRADDDVGDRSTHVREDDHDGVAGHVDHAPPRIAPIRERPQPHEPDTAEGLCPHKRRPAEPDLTAAAVAEPGGEDRHVAACPDDGAAERVVTGPGRAIGRRRVVVEDPHAPRAISRASHPSRLRHGTGRPPRRRAPRRRMPRPRPKASPRMAAQGSSRRPARSRGSHPR